MPPIRDIAPADYPMVEELLYLTDLEVVGSYDPGGLDVIVAEFQGRLVGVAEFELHRDFGHEEGREAHPDEQTFIHTVAVAPTDRRGGVGQALLTEIARRAQVQSLGFVSVPYLHEHRFVTVKSPRSLTPMTVHSTRKTNADLRQRPDPHCLSPRCHTTERSHLKPGGRRQSPSAGGDAGGWQSG
ncbi:N-acetyltransferase family protein [Streptomyces sp. NPDC001919]